MKVVSKRSDGVKLIAGDGIDKVPQISGEGERTTLASEKGEVPWLSPVWAI